MRILADTSAWSLLLRRDPSLDHPVVGLMLKLNDRLLILNEGRRTRGRKR
jgi:hypothetical protein